MPNQKNSISASFGNVDGIGWCILLAGLLTSCSLGVLGEDIKKAACIQAKAGDLDKGQRVVYEDGRCSVR